MKLVGSSRRLDRRVAFLLAAIAVPLALDGCARHQARSNPQPPSQQQQIESARRLCYGLGYTPGTPEFAQCAQQEYDRTATAQAAPPSAFEPTAPVPTSATAAATAPAGAEDDDWLVRYLKRPNYCGQSACNFR